MKLLALDLEMNKDPDEPGKIIQIGAIVGDTITGEVLERLSVYIDPHQQLTPFIIQLTNITQEQVDTGVSLLEGYEQLKDLHTRHQCFRNALVWGGGDSATLLQQLNAEGFQCNEENWIFGRRWIDAKTLFISWRIANNQSIQSGLSKAMSKVGLQFKGTKHSACDDAFNTFKIYIKLLQYFKEKA